MLIVFFVMICAILSMAPVFRDQRDFLQTYSYKMRPAFPVTSEELQQAIHEDPDNITSITTQTTGTRLKLIWGHHNDPELNDLARRVRRGFYRTLAIMSVVPVMIILATLGQR